MRRALAGAGGGPLDVEIERSLARWDHLARLDTSWMCWLELSLIIRYRQGVRVSGCGWPGSDLDLGCGSDGDVDEPTRPNGLCRPGGRPGTPWPGQDEGDSTAAELENLASQAGRFWQWPWTAWTAAGRQRRVRLDTRRTRRRLVGGQAFFLFWVESRLGEPDIVRSGP